MSAMQGLISRLLSICSFSTLMFALVFLLFNLDDNIKTQLRVPSVSFSIIQPPTIKYSTTFEFDESSIIFNFTTNLQPFATWNTKSFYLYALVKLEQNGKVLLQTIIHDWVIVNKFDKDPKNLFIENNQQMSRFTVKDKHRKLRGANLTLNIYCIKHKSVGFPQTVKLFEDHYKLPDKYNYDEEELHRIYNSYKP